MLRVICVIGTRPEVVKLAPLRDALRRQGNIAVTIVDSGQQPSAFSVTAAAFNLNADISLNVHRPGQSLADLTASLLPALHETFLTEQPDLVIVQGDTQTAFCGALAAALLHLPVAHVEAGLRSGDLAAPFPEEINRRQIADLADLHFAPTETARANLMREGIAANAIAVTGNTIVDSLVHFYPRETAPQQNKYILVSAHRRESWGEDIEQICRAVTRLRHTHPDTEVRFILPFSPRPRMAIQDMLQDIPRINLMEPQPYPAFLRILSASKLVISDSGGILEEAVSLGIPTVVTRNVLDRPEALDMPWVRLSGTQEEQIYNAAHALLRLPVLAAPITAGPFGDGNASARIAMAIDRWRRGQSPLLQSVEEFHDKAFGNVRHG